LAAHHPELPPVYSTPDMIRLMETACFKALQPYCEDGEITVGISIHVEHRAASGVGMHIRATAELESFDGRFYIMRVEAHDGIQEIGRGTVGRAVVHVQASWSGCGRKLAVVDIGGKGEVVKSQADEATQFRIDIAARSAGASNAWDVASARIFEDAGFPAIATTSAGIAFSLDIPMASAFRGRRCLPVSAASRGCEGSGDSGCRRRLWLQQ